MEILKESFSWVEQKMIQGLWSTTPIHEIATILNRDYAETRRQIESMDKRGHKLYEQIIEKPMPRKPKPIPDHIKRRDRKMESRVIDYAKLINVRIDARTVIQVKPGTDIEAIRKKYTNYKNEE